VRRAIACSALVAIVVGCGQPAKRAAPVSPSPSPTAALQATAGAFHAGEVAAVYTPVTLTVGGGTAPYSWSVPTGSLPDGLSIALDGTLSGNPSHAGDFSFTIEVTDSKGSTADIAGTIAIAQALSASLLPWCAQACQVEAGCNDVCGRFGTVGGGTPPYTYKASGSIPPGVQLSASELSYVGVFSQAASYWQSTVTVTDAFGETASVSPVFNVLPHISVTGEDVNLPGDGGWVIVRYSGGYGVPSAVITDWSWTGTLCSNSAAEVPTINQIGNGIVKILVIPAPYTTTAYRGTFRVLVTDQAPCGAAVKCSAYGSAAFTKSATGC
jgi:hypothetical protein